MSNPYYIGTSPEQSLGNSPRYFYAVRRNEDGELFFLRSDQIKDKDIITINNPGVPSENFEDLEPGIDYFEGVDEDHELTDDNLFFTQYRWDDRSILYYIDDQGQLVQRINFNYEYPDGISSDG
jgi:hypothetical protein